jgi:Domain of unknown function (DUF4340)
MIKTSTLIVLICAVALAAAVYFVEKRPAKEDKPSGESKPAFTIAAQDLSSISLSHPAQPAIRLEKHNDKWQIVQPIETEADQSSAQGIVDQLTEDRVAQTEPGGADRLKAYGLDSPQTTVDLQVKGGAKHTLLIGDKDFTGDSVYALIDGGPQVSLLPASLGTSADKSLDDLRNRNVLDIDSADVSSFTLKNPSGEFAAALGPSLDRSPENDQWKFSKPTASPADKSAVEGLISAVANAKMKAVVNEQPNDLGKYGLANPAILFTAGNKSGQSTLVVGKKQGDTYYARDLSRPMIFSIDEDLYKKLAQGFGDLRDRKVLHLDASSIDKVEIQDPNGAITLTRAHDNPDQWTIDAPPNLKGKQAASWKFLDPITNLQADEVVDHPAANLAALVAKPAITVVLTDHNKKQITVRISKATGDNAYANTSDGPQLYKLKKQVLNDLNFKPADLAI